jgi:hypothetical protein
MPLSVFAAIPSRLAVTVVISDKGDLAVEDLEKVWNAIVMVEIIVRINIIMILHICKSRCIIVHVYVYTYIYVHLYIHICACIYYAHVYANMCPPSDIHIE